MKSSGDKVRFEKDSITAAQDALIAQKKALKCLRSALDPKV